MTQHRIWIDGSCEPNPGPGGWAFVARCGGQEHEVSGAQADTTNNRMELTAVLEALRSLPDGAVVEVITDSRYVIGCCQDWLPGWKRRGWRRKGGSILNRDLIEPLDVELSRVVATFTWVRGHSGNVMNERADLLANAARRGADRTIYQAARQLAL